MKKLLIIFLVSLSLSAYGQADGTFNRLIAKSIYLRNWVDTFKTDTSFLGYIRSVPTADAVRRFTEGRISGAISQVGLQEVTGIGNWTSSNISFKYCSACNALVEIGYVGDQGYIQAKDTTSGYYLKILPTYLQFQKGLVNGLFKWDNLATSNKTIQLPNTSGTVALTSDIQTYTNGYGLSLSSNQFSVESTEIVNRLRLKNTVDSMVAVNDSRFIKNQWALQNARAWFDSMKVKRAFIDTLNLTLASPPTGTDDASGRVGDVLRDSTGKFFMKTELGWYRFNGQEWNSLTPEQEVTVAYNTISSTSTVQSDANLNLTKKWVDLGIINTKVIAFYPMTGSSVNNKRFNMLNPLDDSLAFRLTLYGSPTSHASGISFGASDYATTNIDASLISGGSGLLGFGYLLTTATQNIFIGSTTLSTVVGFHSDNANLLAYPNIYASSSGINYSSTPTGGNMSPINANVVGRKFFQRRYNRNLEFWNDGKLLGYDVKDMNVVSSTLLLLNKNSTTVNGTAVVKYVIVTTALTHFEQEALDKSLSEWLTETGK